MIDKRQLIILIILSNQITCICRPRKTSVLRTSIRQDRNVGFKGRQTLGGIRCVCHLIFFRNKERKGKKIEATVTYQRNAPNLGTRDSVFKLLFFSGLVLLFALEHNPVAQVAY